MILNQHRPIHADSTKCKLARQLWEHTKTLIVRPCIPKWLAVNEGDRLVLTVLHNCTGHLNINAPHCCPKLGCFGHCRFAVKQIEAWIKKVIFLLKIFLNFTHDNIKPLANGNSLKNLIKNFIRRFKHNQNGKGMGRGINQSTQPTLIHCKYY